ncbi:phosphoribosylanthranilate isomerase [Campylobacter geochelonis]|uniref:N-(5'-phosphoribosyl)anthranilate isomerase n=1 Tax=Campylobacter geochelonis TaxID=1780362 RepID=A0A128E9Z8_9BACT|nr:phosphoribosylanthranilate isomerase [Campylobacter geochelonis]QKF70656.1 phosphoribosylanthranilate isomerase [Campylobacter geochelonis]CZE45846.1 N-(5'phosphoribosyl)anthranilate isomerase [Campylobacter geochelonis]
MEIKICGIKNIDEARDVARLGVDYLGVIFAPSIRQVSLSAATQIAQIAHENGKKCVGVFVAKTDSLDDTVEDKTAEFSKDLSSLSACQNTKFKAKNQNSAKYQSHSECDNGKLSEDKILEFCKSANLDVAQIYGKFSVDLAKNLTKNGIKVWKVYSVSNVLPELDSALFDMPLFDCKGLKLGGNGTSFEWEILRKLDKQKFVLAGGIGADNITLAATFTPAVLDINSKAEDENGIKSSQKIKEILAKISHLRTNFN